MNTLENKIYLSVKDHSVSGEAFQLIHNESMDMLETFPKLSEDKLGDYYLSEDYISHTDAKRNALEKVYHFIKGIALKRKLKLLESFNTADKTLLDVGCGTGDFLKVALNNNWEVCGIEPNESARSIANSKTNDLVFNSDQLLKLKPYSFDVITLWHVLEHLPKLDEHISIFESLLKPNGSLVVAVPNFKSYDARYYDRFWAAYDVPRHLWHFSQEAISRLVNKKNMEVVKTVPMTFDSYYVSLLSEKYKNGFMNPVKAFWIGWRSNTKARRSGEFSSLIYVIKKR